MIIWTLDPDQYGMPDYGTVVGQSRTFTAYLGDKGRGRYMPYNPTGPIPVQLVYGWDGATLAQFRIAWESRRQLAFGANWMRVTLPFDIVRGERGVKQFDAHFVQPISASSVSPDWWKVQMSLELDASEALVTS